MHEDPFLETAKIMSERMGNALQNQGIASKHYQTRASVFAFNVIPALCHIAGDLTESNRFELSRLASLPGLRSMVNNFPLPYDLKQGLQLYLKSLPCKSAPIGVPQCDSLARKRLLSLEEHAIITSAFLVSLEKAAKLRLAS